jgi:hypothetical protein
MTPLREYEVPDYADVFTLSEFEASCLSFCFTDYDGSGNYAKDGKMYGPVCCRDIAAGQIDRRYTHVAWFNK